MSDFKMTKPAPEGFEYYMPVGGTEPWLRKIEGAQVVEAVETAPVEQAEEVAEVPDSAAGEGGTEAA